MAWWKFWEKNQKPEDTSVNKPKAKYKIVLQLFTQSSKFYEAQRAKLSPGNSDAYSYWARSNWADSYSIASDLEVTLPKGSDSVEGIFENLRLPNIEGLSDAKILERIKKDEYILAIATLQKLKRTEGAEEKWQWDDVKLIDFGDIEDLVPEIISSDDEIKSGILKGKIKKETI